MSRAIWFIDARGRMFDLSKFSIFQDGNDGTTRGYISAAKASDRIVIRASLAVIIETIEHSLHLGEQICTAEGGRAR